MYTRTMPYNVLVSSTEGMRFIAGTCCSDNFNSHKLGQRNVACVAVVSFPIESAGGA